MMSFRDVVFWLGVLFCGLVLMGRSSPSTAPARQVATCDESTRVSIEHRLRNLEANQVLHGNRLDRLDREGIEP